MEDTPRVSGTLRALFRGEAADLLKGSQTRARKLKAALRASVVDSVGAGKLTWAGFVEGVEETDEKLMRKQRMTFNLFLSEIKDLVGDETNTDEVHESAFAVFNLLDDVSQSDQVLSLLRAAPVFAVPSHLLGVQAKQAQLAKILRTESVAKNTFASLQVHVRALSEWRAGLAGGALHAREDSKSSSNTNQREYGREVLFQFDTADFLFREPVKVSKQPEVVRMGGAPPSSSQSLTSKPRKEGAAAEQRRAAAAPAAAPSMVAVGNWLQDDCLRHCSTAAGSTGADDLYRSVVAVAKSAPSAEAFQGQLFDLLGVEGLDLMEKVVSKWASVKAMDIGKPAVAAGQGAAPPQAQPAPPMTGGIVVNLESDKKGQQRRRKDELKAKKQQQSQPQLDAQPDTTRLLKLMEDGDRSALPAVERNDYIAGGTARMAEHKFVMPEGARHQDTQEFESVWLPPKRPPYRSDDSLVPVTEFEPWARTAFKGYEKLNRIQSSVFSSAYHSNENLLICAPTGAGKTNIAMLAILREIGLNRTADGRIQKDQFKICYVAPMKVRLAISPMFVA
jgi:hypothetical protein